MNTANAGGLFLKTQSSLPTGRLYITHISGATEGVDNSFDAPFLENWAPAVDIYSKTNYDYPADRLRADCRPPESMTTINGEILGRGLPEIVDVDLLVQFFIPQGEDNFIGKQVIGDFYKGDEWVASYDMKHVAANEGSIPLKISNGKCYDMKIRFYDLWDVNRDRQVDNKDFAELAEGYKGGKYGIADVQEFSKYWLMESASACGE